MKTIARIVGGLMMMSIMSFGQTIDDQRMERDIQVVENVLSTLLRQQFDKQRLFFPLEVKGSYQPGYGVTFRLPADFTTPIVFSFDRSFEGSGDGNLVWDAPAPPAAPHPPGTFSYSYRIESDDEFTQEDREVIEHRIEEADKREKKIKIQKEEKNAIVLKEKATKDKEKKIKDRKISLDSVRDSYNEKVITASKDFLADYGDLLSQLAPGEKIVITNQGEQPRMWVGKLMNAPNRTHLSIEMLKGDITQYKQGKFTRDQLMAKIKVVNTETVEAVEPDIELLSSIFDRLYQADLARTYFTEDRIYFERLKDYGVVYYMQVFSSNQQDYELFSMPTLKLRDIDLETRNKKVIELYPEFERELKENILEYGRTVKSLKDNEVLVFNVKITKCPACGIPSTLEVSVQGSVLKEYSAGKIDKATTLSKLSIKKGANQ
jgi:hypothetical protein